MRRMTVASTWEASSRAWPPTCAIAGGQSLDRTASRASSQRCVATSSPRPGSRWALEAAETLGRRCCVRVRRAWASELATAGTSTRHHTVCRVRSKRCRSREATATQSSVSACSQARSSAPSLPAWKLSDVRRTRSARLLLHQKTSPVRSSPVPSATAVIAWIARFPKVRPVTGPSRLTVRASRRAGPWLRRVRRLSLVFCCPRAQWMAASSAASICSCSVACLSASLTPTAATSGSASADVRCRLAASLRRDAVGLLPSDALDEPLLWRRGFPALLDPPLLLRRWPPAAAS
mmetsp:Transcript_11160/g.31636  ORF Transcript_11160/g.31636 Transcript_11160/m.31636 type:complete len:292 (-) Transcript_11160:2324-3199(-)